MATTLCRPVPVKLLDLMNAYDFADFNGGGDSEAYYGLKTGEFYYVSDYADGEEVPDDLADSPDYIAVPDRRDLDLGRRLALSFVAEELPADLEEAHDMFRRKGAYRRFRNLVERRHVLEKWYAFEQAAIEQALRAWCADNGLKLSDD